MKKSLSSIRVQQKTAENMVSAIRKYNESSIFSVSEAEFRRMAIELLSQLILQDKEIPIKVTTS